MQKTRALIVMGCCVMLGVSLCGCAAESERAQGSSASAESDKEYTKDVFAMDTYMTLTAYGENAREAVEAGSDEIKRLDALFSTGDEGSEIYAVNAAGGGSLSDEAAYLVKRSIEVYEKTGGVYDISIYPVMALWGFTDENYAVPDPSELEETLSRVDAGKLAVTEDDEGATLSMEDGMQIDLGGIVKGYAGDRVSEIFKDYGITSGMINLGGDVHVLGEKPDGSEWRVGIRDPEDSSGYLGALSLCDTSVVTSGGYERYFEDEETGVRYHHIIDPRDGYPAYNGLISVSVVSGDGALADALSTSLFILGTEDGIAYCEKHCAQEGFDALLETENGEIYITGALADRFIDLDGDADLHIIDTP